MIDDVFREFFAKEAADLAVRIGAHREARATPEYRAEVVRMDDCVRSFAQTLRVLALAATRHAGLLENSLFLRHLDDLSCSAVMAASAFREGAVNPGRRELRFLLELGVQAAYVDESAGAADFATRVDLFRRRRKPHSAEHVKDLELSMLGGSRSRFVDHVVSLWSRATAYVHPSPTQLKEKLELTSRGISLGFESADQIRECVDALLEVCAAAVVLALHVVGPSTAGDLIVDRLDSDDAWPFHASEFIAAIDASFDHRHERLARSAEIVARRQSRIVTGGRAGGNTTAMTRAEDIEAAFLEQHGAKYQLSEHLGRGAHGASFRGTELRIQSNVSVKLTHRSIPNDSPRDWTAAANVKHDDVAQIRTVELFDVGSSRHAAIVSDYVPGITLDHALIRLAGPRGDRARARLAPDVMRSLAVALEHCHERGVWHGDLHERNVIVRPAKRALDRDAMFGATLIDFGTSSVCDEKHQSAAEWMRDDMAQLHRLATWLAGPLPWSNAFAAVIRRCSSPGQVKEAVDAVISIVGSLDNLDRDSWTEQRFHTAQRVVLTGAAPYDDELRAMIQAAADRMGVRDRLDAASKRLSDRILSDPAYPRITGTVHSRNLVEDRSILELLGMGGVDGNAAAS